ncbi:T9SS type A sorting domain-containing protein [Marinilongibacter aquaticus]|uniref:T9SS type A sorting domain-containing protein n=1 Tax=Marinilongibacter aquaticus TaxID=2975157 RepID=UPI0021BD3AA5|nr:T9SS type A sorting domain-containing protein [Marinilongibacter aquaticus]UBM60283.1 T9SS type A sorting domain-containing protein [Marinilongibacter aquaticus]
MKKLFIQGAILTAMCLAYSQTQAQTEDKVKIRIEKKVDGKTKVIEREIDTRGMSEDEKNAAIENLQDSLFNDMDGGKNVEVQIETRNLNGDHDMLFEDEDVQVFGDENPRVRVYKKHKKGGADEWDDFRWEMDRLGQSMRDFGNDFPKHFERNFPRVYAWTDNVLREMEPEGIRSVDVFPNKPDSDVINVRFYAAEKGDVNITVLDTKGKTVASKEVKDFQGEFVGQMELKKSAKGTFFVLVSQGDDGVSRRVVIE